MQNLICSLAEAQDKTTSISEKKLLDDLIDMAIDLQRDEKRTIIVAFNDGQNHGMFNSNIPVDAGAIYYNNKFVKNKYKDDYE